MLDFVTSEFTVVALMLAFLCGLVLAEEGCDSYYIQSVEREMREQIEREHGKVKPWPDETSGHRKR